MKSELERHLIEFAEELVIKYLLLQCRAEFVMSNSVAQTKFFLCKSLQAQIHYLDNSQTNA